MKSAITLSIVLIMLLLTSCGGEETVADLPERPRSSVERVLAFVLTKPDFLPEEVKAQILGKGVEIEKVGRNRQDIYISFPKAQEEDVIGQIIQDLDSVRWGKQMDGIVSIGRVWVEDTMRHLIRMPIENLKINPDQDLTTQLGQHEYALNPQEFWNLHYANTLYNSPAIFVYNSPQGKASLANHMAPVARANEPTLQPLVENITANDSTSEQKIQSLLNFVTNEIAYESHGKYEIFMKPHETLLSGKSDCSGKVVLFASLLEQIEAPYLLVYTPGHISVGVQGEFLTGNQMNFLHEGKRYFIAETTVENFKIGETWLIDPLTEDKFIFLQAPGFQSKVYDVVKGDSLEFLTMQVEVKQ